MNLVEPIDIRTGKPFTGLQKARPHGSIPCECIEGSWGRARGLMGGAFMGCMLAQQGGGGDPYLGKNAIVIHFNDGEVAAGTAYATVTSISRISTALPIVINWGDGTTQNITTASSAKHTYTADGDYVITMDGNVRTFGFGAYRANENRGNHLLRVYFAPTITELPTSIVNTFYGNTKLVSVFGLEQVVSIPNNEFQSCSSLGTIGDSSAFLSIGNDSFNGCTSLVSVGNLTSCTTIGDSAFRTCSALVSVGNLTSCTTIGGYAFQNCFALTSVGNLSSCTSIGNYAFVGDTKLVQTGPWPAIPPAAGNAQSVPGTGSILIPRGSLSAYQSAQHWSSASARFVEV